MGDTTRESSAEAVGTGGADAARGAGGAQGEGSGGSSGEVAAGCVGAGGLGQESGGHGDRHTGHTGGAPVLGAAESGIPDNVACPFCDGRETELHSAFGGQLSTATYWCRRCRTAFEWFKWERR